MQMKSSSMAEKKKQEKLISSKVTLRAFRLSDAGDMWSYLTNPEMTRYTEVPWKEGMFKSKEDVESYIQNFCIPNRYCRSVCIDEDRSVGMVIISPGIGGSSWRRGNFAALVSPEYWSKGVCTRAVEIAAVDGFRAIPEMTRLDALTDVENKGAQKVLERVGFQREGDLRKFMFYGGEDRDMVIYSMLVDDQTRLALVKKMFSSSNNIIISSRL